ncbi:hypothetical protein ACEWBS_22400 [Vibrio parahaemolyticus]|uniref:hypothetical protein n=1 Tax=Vibrio parahaemolyticus TaxID=670 RepID=UPI00111D59F1|nr:hypothetical protein [Vibrio parahaemolyticus]TOQ38734.1 hypothetical protein CGG95_25100 [Vibrio parahaemolyticus]TOR21895.1 hypothetical protein CGG79_25490 [Vibrio parahaemolyticus]HCE4563773.1 hypothetical protein [Vibrio parahaemolyticus]HCG5611455.1 hypothetical protein [Vibrio parahaemolyticus]
MSKELIEFLRPYALLVIEQNGKIKAADFYQKLLLTCKNCGVDESWIESNSHQISIFTQKLIDVALCDWLEKQYKNYPHPTVRDGNKVISGKVESVSETSASSMYSYSEQCGWDLWRASGMSGGKKLQEITLHDEANSYYVVWGKDAIGVRQFNIIDFEWVDKNGYQIIVKKTLEGHGEGVGNSKSVTVNQVHYPSIRSAYARIYPQVTYSTVCARLRKGQTPEDAFDKPSMRLNSDINKLGIVVRKDNWVKSRRSI